MNKNQTKNEWKQRGYTCNQWVDTPLNEYLNLCEDEKILKLISGKLIITFEDSQIELLVSEEVVIPTGTVHSLSVGSEDVEWWYGYKQGSDIIIDEERGENFSVSQKVMHMMVPPKRKRNKSE
ncbi:MAG: hypothetical protein OCC49_11275 [Fibrobacterales bacterium]